MLRVVSCLLSVGICLVSGQWFPGNYEEFASVVASTPVALTEKCERLILVVEDVIDFEVAIIRHIVVDTTILESKVPVFLLEHLKTIPPEQIPGLMFADNDVMTKLQNIVCIIANAKSLSDLGTRFQVTPEVIRSIPPPVERKKFLGYLLLQSRVLKETLNDFFDELASSGYPVFPLQVDNDAVNEKHGAYLVAAKELFFMQTKAFPGYSNDLRQYFWSTYNLTESMVLYKLLEATSYHEAMSGELLPIDFEGLAIAIDIIFDAVENRDLYFGIFDLLESMVLAVTDTGILDLPV